MSFTYNNDPQNSVIDRIRLEIGDTVSRNAQISDEEINHAYLTEGTVLRAAARCCEWLAARYTGEGQFRSASLSLDKSGLQRRYQTLARRLRQRGTTADSFVIPSLRQTDKDSFTEDTDLVQHRVSLGMHDNPDADEDSFTAES